MDELIEQQVAGQINAVDMGQGVTYVNITGKIKIKLKEKKDGVVWVHAWSDAHQEWRAVKVEENYKVRLPTKGELAMAETAEKEVKVKVKKEKAPPKNIGKIRGLKMLATWGQVYKDVGMNGLQAVKDAMIEEFPDKVESINKWAAAYRIYYNTGRLPGITKPEPEGQVIWITEAKAARDAAKLARAEARAAKLANRDEEKRIKKEARKAAQAEARAAKAEARAAEKAAKEAEGTDAPPAA